MKRPASIDGTFPRVKSHLSAALRRSVFYYVALLLSGIFVGMVLKEMLW